MPNPPTSMPVDRPLRRDARRNRDAVLAAARRTFARHGLQAPLEWIAKDADVGISTLYRNFPTRDDLIEAVVADKVAEWIGLAEQALECADPWAGLVGYLAGICDRQAADQSFTDIVSTRFPGQNRIEPRLRQIHQLSRQVVTRARDAGQLRADVDSEDLMLVLWAHSRVVEMARSTRPDIGRRHLALMLDAFRPAAAHQLPVPPMSPEEVAQAMAAAAEPGRPHP